MEDRGDGSRTPADGSVSDDLADATEAAANVEPDREMASLRGTIVTVLGLDLVLRVAPDVIAWIATYLGAVARLFDVPAVESAILLGVALGHPATVWALSWITLAVIGVVYVPKLVRPGAADWPSALPSRVALTVPMLGAGLLAEAGFRWLLGVVVEPTPAPVALPSSGPFAIGLVAATLVLFGGVWWADDDRTDARTLPGYLLRALALVAIVGVFFAQFSLLSPYSEVLAVVLFALSRDELPADPAERLTEGAATIWERSAQALMMLYVTGALAVVVFAVLAVRVRVPPSLPWVAPYSTAFLVLVAGSATFHTYMFGDRMLRRFRRGFDPEVESERRVEGFLVPAAILVSLLLVEYVFGDPTAGPGLLETAVGLTVAPAAVMMVLLSNDQGRPDRFDELSEPDEPAPLSDSIDRRLAPAGSDDGPTASARGVDLVESVDLDGAVPVVEYVIRSSRDDPVRAGVEKAFPHWVVPGAVALAHDLDEGEDFFADRWVTYETTVPPNGARTLRYAVPVPETATPENLVGGLLFRVGIGEGPVAKDEDTNRERFDLYSFPDYHLAPLAVATFLALLGAVRPLEGQYLVTAILDGSILALDPWTVGGRFVLILALVVFPYVPFGVSSYLAAREDLRRRLGAEQLPLERMRAVRYRGGARASVWFFLGASLIAFGLPVVGPLAEVLLAAGVVAAGVVAAISTASIAGTIELARDVAYLLVRIVILTAANLVQNVVVSYGFGGLVAASAATFVTDVIVGLRE